MTTIAEISETTETPQEALKSALDAIADARQLIQDTRRDRNTAQERADETKGFTAAAQLEFNNAEARYLVLVNSRDYAALEEKEQQEEYDRLAEKLAAVKAEIALAHALEDWVKQAKAALNKTTTSAKQWATRAGKSVGALQKTAKALETAANTASKECQPDLSRAQRSVQEEHDALNGDVDVLRQNLDAVKGEVEAVPEVPRLAELRANATKLQKDLDALGAKQKRRQPSVTVADVHKAEEDRDNARRALEDAPNAERAAQADLAAKQAALDEAHTTLSAANAAFEAAEREFIAQIDVTEPDATGWATARARLKRPIPDGYILRWQAGGAPMKPETGIGETVRIDANALPVGDTAVEVTIERQPKNA